MRMNRRKSWQTTKKLMKMAALIDRKSKEITPDVYAAIALSLHRKHGWGYQRISALFKVSHDIWEECVQTGIDMRKMCEDETGIEVVGAVNER